jgi:hypothetical protein
MRLRRLGDAGANTTMPGSAETQAIEARPEQAGAVELPEQSMATVPAGLENLQRRRPLRAFSRRRYWFELMALT